MPWQWNADDASRMLKDADVVAAKVKANQYFDEGMKSAKTNDDMKKLIHDTLYIATSEKMPSLAKHVLTSGAFLKLPPDEIVKACKNFVQEAKKMDPKTKGEFLEVITDVQDELASKLNHKQKADLQRELRSVSRETSRF